MINDTKVVFEYAALAAERSTASQEREIEILRRMSEISDELHLTGEAILKKATGLAIKTMQK